MGSQPTTKWDAWLGRTELREDWVCPSKVAALAATLDVEPPAGPQPQLPPLWHWMFFADAVRPAEIGPDGHPKRGAFLPPVPLPRRMWAGGRLEFLAPMQVGESIRRASRIASIQQKSGRSGSLVFVTVQHEVSGARGIAVREEHDIVYRDAPAAGASPAAATTPASTDAAFEREIVPDPVLLFRYSALTFNGHRIHYDRSYVTEVEGYPGLVVHGPLIATLLMELGRAYCDGTPRRYEFKAMHPLFDTSSFFVCGRDGRAGKVQLWARDPGGRLAMQALLECKRSPEPS
jgi:3-methylfumaryl-CoA hydratase